MRCYFCHGYDGNARTVAAGMLDPKPRDFTRAAGLDRDRIVATLRAGRPGTAMKPFGELLSPVEIEDVAGFVAEVFVRCAARNTRYHTDENGWPDQAARYGAAFPFATGELPLDAPESVLGPDERAGLALFRSTCISCHEGRLARPAALGLAIGVPNAPDVGLWTGRGPHVDEYDRPTIHDIAPVILDLTPVEAEGGALYAAACAECHAADGTGRNWIGSFLHPDPPDFTAAAFARSFTLPGFARQTLDPPPDTAMPSFRGVLSEAETQAIAIYVGRAFVRQPAGG